MQAQAAGQEAVFSESLLRVSLPSLSSESLIRVSHPSLSSLSLLRVTLPPSLFPSLSFESLLRVLHPSLSSEPILAHVSHSRLCRQVWFDDKRGVTGGRDERDEIRGA